SLPNSSLRFGFDHDKAFFLDFTNNFQIYLAVISALTIHPAVLYFLIFKSKSMTLDIKIGYVWNTVRNFLSYTNIQLQEQISAVINEWYLSLVFRPYFFFPYDAIYCDGPICRMGLPKSLLITLFVFFVVSE
ncbi:hypothetical protein PFISCL1PPCAC_13646, partial [Pristionchus fissidentatus]